LADHELNENPHLLICGELAIDSDSQFIVDQGINKKRQ